MWKMALRIAVLSMLLVIASTELPFGETVRANGTCYDTNCYDVMLACSDYYLMDQEEPCEYNPFNPSATHEYRFICYDGRGEVRFIVSCAY